jgi:hypothetical protein
MTRGCDADYENRIVAGRHRRVVLERPDEMKGLRPSQQPASADGGCIQCREVSASIARAAEMTLIVLNRYCRAQESYVKCRKHSPDHEVYIGHNAP